MTRSAFDAFYRGATATRSEWISVDEMLDSVDDVEARTVLVPWLEILGKDCLITLNTRPPTCDRGNYLAQLETRGELSREIDAMDLWPRFYFDLERAKLEVEAWMKKRGQWR